MEREDGEMMIRDRGKKKWQGFFMPEHTRELRKIWKDGEKQPRPQLSEEQIEEMEQAILESLEHQVLIELTIWENGYFQKRVGTVQRIDPLSKKIAFLDELGSNFVIVFSALQR
jgi:O-succinylbenzoate synthase